MGKSRALELDTKLRIEPEANRARFRGTHRMIPSAAARHARYPHFSPALSDYGPIDSPLKIKMRAEMVGEHARVETAAGSL